MLYDGDDSGPKPTFSAYYKKKSWRSQLCKEECTTTPWDVEEYTDLSIRP